MALRTAESIIDNLYISEKYVMADELTFEFVVDAINEARSEAIRECAEKAKSGWVRFGTNMGHQVEKDSILNLLTQIK